MIEGNVPEFRFSATFRLFGPVLDVAGISTELGVSPTFACAAGDLGPQRKPYSRATWQYTAPVEETASLDRHLLALWGVLGASKPAIEKFSGQFEADVNCWFHSNLDWSDFVITPAALTALAAFDVPVRWSIMVVSD